MSALADEGVGKFVNKYCVSSFQRVGSFRIKAGQKQGGNVAAYFCATDGRVLHVIAGPVDAKTFLEEAKWIVEKTAETIKGSKGDATRFKELIRKSHAERLENKYSTRVTPMLKDGTMHSLATASAYRDSEGRRLAPLLTLPEIENPADLKGQAPTAAKVHRLLAGHAIKKIEDVFGAIFEGILGEKVTTKPVEADRPFTGRGK